MLPSQADVDALQEELNASYDTVTPEAVKAAYAKYVEVLDSAEDGNAIKFDYAKLCVFSRDDRKMETGLDVLQGLLVKGYQPSEVMFHVAVGHFSRGEFSDCRKALARLVKSDPHNARAATFLKLLEGKVVSDGTRFAVIAGVCVVAAAAIALFLRRRGSKPSAPRHQPSPPARPPMRRGLYGRF